MAPGSTVKAPRSVFGVVLSVGECDYPQCKHTVCVAVMPEGKRLSVCYDASELEVIE